MDDIEQQVQALWTEGYTVSGIVRELHTYRDLVRKVLTKMGVSKDDRQRRGVASQKTVNPEEDEAIFQDWLSGLTSDQIAKKYHTSDHRVTNILNAREISMEVRNGRRGKKKVGPVRKHCCACGIILEYCDKYDKVLCEDCSYLECRKRKRKEGDMCDICQRHLNVEPTCAGNK